MKVKHLLVLAAFAVGSSAWAQTDVTSTYLVNPSFELKAEGTAATAEALTNDGTYYGWKLPNLGTSFVNISIGNSTECNNNAFGVPTAKDGATYYYCRRGWGSNSSPDATLSTSATLPAGSYTLAISYKGLDSYDSSHNTKGSYLTLSAVSGGSTLASTKTSNFENVNGNAAGKDKFKGDANWKEVSVSFDVEGESEVTLNIIHHLVGGVRTDVVVDDVKLYAITALEKAQNEAKAALPAPLPEFFGLTEAQLEDYESQIDDATSVAEVEAIMEEVNNYQAPALSGKWAILNATNGMYLGDAKLSAESKTATFEKADGGFYIKIDDNYINMAGNNAWSMSADPTPKTAWSFALANGKYTIEGPNGLIGTDATTDGAALYGNKGVANNGYWTIVDLAAAELASAKAALQEMLDKITVPTANIEGESESLVVWGAEDVEDMKAVLEEAQDVLDNSTSIDEVNEQIETLEDIGLTSLNNIKEEEPYNIIMAKDGLAWTGNAVTFTYSEGNQNNYAMAYSAVAGESNYNQSIGFILTAGGNYNMYTIDAGGNKWYVTDGTHVGSTVAWAGSQIRMTSEADDAMPIDILPSLDKEGVCEIYNSWTGEHVGSTNNNGFYCSNDNFDLIIQPAAKKTVTINTSYKYATAIIPGSLAIPESVKVYTVTGIDEDNALVLAEETERIKPNVPYIIEDEVSELSDASELKLVFYAMGFKSKYTEGLLTGAYEEISVPRASYVLQNQPEEGIGFYIVASDDITITANHCYLSAEASEAKALHFPSDDATAIKAIDALTSGNAGIYTIDGVKVNSLQKGLNIIKTADGKTQKVLVK